MPENNPAEGGAGEMSNKAFAMMRKRIKELEERLEEAEEEKTYSGDDDTRVLKKEIRALKKELHEIRLGDIGEDTYEGVIAENPWIASLKKADQLQAVKRILALSQSAETNAGDSPGMGRTKQTAAAYAHVTGGGPPAGGASSRSDTEREFSEYQKKMSAAKTQADRDQLADDWAKNHPEESGPM